VIHFFLTVEDNKNPPEMKTKFIKDRESTVYFYITLTEMVLSVATFYAAAYIREPSLRQGFLFTREYQLLMLVMIFSWLFILRSKNFEKFHRTQTYSEIFIDYTKGIALGAAILTGAIFLFKLESISRGFVIIFTPLNLMVLYFFRLSFYRGLKNIRSRGKNRKYVVVIGDESSENIIDKIITNREWGLQIVKIISNSGEIFKKYHRRIPVVPEQNDLHRMLELDVIDEIIYYKNTIDQKELNKIIYSCEEVGVVFHLYSECWNLTGRKYHLSYFGDMPYFTFMNKPSDYFALHIKQIMDYSFALVMMVLLLPLMMVIAIAIKADSQGPVFFKQERVGLRGRRFNLYKFRTMVKQAEEMRVQVAGMNEMDGPVFKIRNDPRITRVGRFLRSSGLDELPQLFNILKGHMSFIGPRPPIMSEVEQYERWQLRRLSMKPGITCIWQTMPKRNEIIFKDWMQMDLHYIDSWSLKLDFIVFVKTFKTVLMRSGQ
jgi:exopolysaccharide biosynthesis polyprenyl glycosylphosphotransferase